MDTYFTAFIFNLPHNFIFDSFFGFFSFLGKAAFVWIIIFLYLIIFEEKKDKQFIIYFVVTLLISGLMIVTFKNLVKRPRPLNEIKNLKLEIKNYPSDYSFPSGHALSAFAAATILAFFNKKRRKIFYSIAILIAFSRVYLGYHYVSDIIGGAIMGWFISRVTLVTQTPLLKSKFKMQKAK